MATNPPTNRFFLALKRARRATGKVQEDFDLISSRTYVSTLERGLKSPTLQKVDELAQVLGLHPLTLLSLAYADHKRANALEISQRRVARELQMIREYEEGRVES